MVVSNQFHAVGIKKSSVGNANFDRLCALSPPRRHQKKGRNVSVQVIHVSSNIQETCNAFKASCSKVFSLTTWRLWTAGQRPSAWALKHVYVFVSVCFMVVFAVLREFILVSEDIYKLIQSLCIRQNLLHPAAIYCIVRHSETSLVVLDAFGTLGSDCNPCKGMIAASAMCGENHLWNLTQRSRENPKNEQMNVQSPATASSNSSSSSTCRWGSLRVMRGSLNNTKVTSRKWKKIYISINSWTHQV